jgi:uncharacterized membrane protein
MSANAANDTAPGHSLTLARSGGPSAAGAAILGFAFGGFFDGILLHQVLEWHHFLSLIPGKDLRTQILADGLFHLATYAVAAFGLLLLWRKGNTRAADRLILAWAVLGFSIWQFTDVVLVHWLVGIHRIRVGVPNPTLWDLGWLAVFGVPSLALGVWLLRSAGRSGPPPHGPSSKVAASLSVLVILSGGLAVYPTRDAATAVFFKSGIGAPASFAAAASVDASVLWSVGDGEVMIIKMPAGGSRVQLYRMGAVLVTSTSWFGCIGRNPT